MWPEVPGTAAQLNLWSSWLCCFWHMKPESKKKSFALDLGEQRRFLRKQYYGSILSLSQSVPNEGKMKNTYRNPVLSISHVLWNPLCDWLNMTQHVFNRNLNLSLLICWLVLYYCGLYYKYRFFCSELWHILKNSTLTGKNTFFGSMILKFFIEFRFFLKKRKKKEREV